MDLAQILEANHLTPKRNRLLRPTRLSKRTEVWYRDKLLGFVGELERITLEKLNRVKLGDAMSTSEKINYSQMLDELIETLQKLAVSNFAVHVASGMVARADDQNKRTILSSLKDAFDINADGLLGSQVIRDTLQLAVDENVNLIQSIKTSYINDIGDTIRQSVIDGRRHTDIVSEIRARGQVSQSRARMIARDQTAKINADLTRERNLSLGITMYVWGTSGDERTREDHLAMKGKICRYDDPTVYYDPESKKWVKRTSNMVKLHPGEDYQCRCTGHPHVLIEAA